jgi:hypothetical protein
MPDATVHTEIQINAPARQVWQGMTDLAGYVKYNPMIRRASGEIKAGFRLKLYFNPSGSKERTFHSKALIVEPELELRWQNQPSMPLLVESKHFFIITPIGANKIHLAHDMFFLRTDFAFYQKHHRQGNSRFVYHDE